MDHDAGRFSSREPPKRSLLYRQVRNIVAIDFVGAQHGRVDPMCETLVGPPS